MKRSKLLLAAVSSGAVLTAVAVPTAVSAVTASNQAAPGASSDAGTTGAAGTTPTGCKYPSSRAPVLTLTADRTALPRAGGVVTFSGTMTVNSCPISGKRVTLYTSDTRNGRYDPTSASATTTTTGAYSIRFTVKRSAYFKGYFPGDTSFDVAMSPPVQVTVAR